MYDSVVLKFCRSKTPHGFSQNLDTYTHQKHQNDVLRGNVNIDVYPEIIHSVILTYTEFQTIQF